MILFLITKIIIFLFNILFLCHSLFFYFLLEKQPFLSFFFAIYFQYESAWSRNTRVRRRTQAPATDAAAARACDVSSTTWSSPIHHKYVLSKFSSFLYFLEQLQNLVSARDTGTEAPTLLETNNFSAIFGLIDITGRGRYCCFSVMNKRDLLAFQKQKLNQLFAKSESKMISFIPSLCPERLSWRQQKKNTKKSTSHSRSNQF